MAPALDSANDNKDLRLGVVLGLLLVAISVVTGPGLVSGKAVFVNCAAVILGLGLVAYGRSRPGPHGVGGRWAVGLFAGFVVLSAFSITWAIDPSATWDEFNRLLGYLAVFMGAVTAARVFPQRWRTVLLGLAIASVVMSAAAVASKVSPELFAPGEQYARLREPLQYWNAVGLIAAFGVPLWLYYGTRRVGKPVLDILAAPALTLLFVTIMLAYSRGALIAGVVGTGVWLVFAPLRLRTATLLVVPLLGAAVIVLWAFGQTDLTTDSIDLLARETAGHRFGVVVAATLVIVTLLSLATQFLIATRAPGHSWRRRVGIVLLTGILLVPIAGAAALSQSQQGLSGTISSGWTKLTNPEANQHNGPANSPNRLSQVGSARSLYWRDAFRVYKAHPVLGAGANNYGPARLRYRTDSTDVAHAHGFLVQVLADLGVIGVGLILALLGAWGVAAKRTLGGRGDPWPPERVGAVALFAAVVVYGVHSTLDWTWSFPAATLPALIASGWIAGRGSITRERAVASAPTYEGTPKWLARASRWAAPAQLAAFAVLALWSITTPYRAFQVSQDALTAIESGDIDEGVKLAKKAVRIDPVSLDTRAIQTTALTAGGDIAGARAVIEKGIRTQPDNPVGWVQLLTFELGPGANAGRAASAYRAALFLDPYSYPLKALINSAITPAPPAAPDAAGGVAVP